MNAGLEETVRTLAQNTVEQGLRPQDMFKLEQLLVSASEDVEFQQRMALVVETARAMGRQYPALAHAWLDTLETVIEARERTMHLGWAPI